MGSTLSSELSTFLNSRIAEFPKWTFLAINIATLLIVLQRTAYVTKNAWNNHQEKKSNPERSKTKFSSFKRPNFSFILITTILLFGLRLFTLSVSIANSETQTILWWPLEAISAFASLLLIANVILSTLLMGFIFNGSFIFFFMISLLTLTNKALNLFLDTETFGSNNLFKYTILVDLVISILFLMELCLLPDIHNEYASKTSKLYPLHNSCFLQRFTFSWMYCVVCCPIKYSDKLFEKWELHPDYDVHELAKSFMSDYRNKQAAGETINLISIFFKINAYQIVSTFIFLALGASFSAGLLPRVLAEIQVAILRNDIQWKIYYICTFYLISTFITSAIFLTNLFRIMDLLRKGMACIILTCYYELISKSNIHCVNSQLIAKFGNITTTDARSLVEIILFLAFGVNAVFELTFLLESGYSLGKYSIFVGIGALIFAFCFGLPFSVKSKKSQKKLLTKKDSRLTRTSELVFNFLTIKLYSWAFYFGKLISEQRATEEKYLNKFLNFIIIFKSFAIFSQILCTLVIFITYFYANNKKLDPLIVNPLLNIALRCGSVILILPFVIIMISNGENSYRRIVEFLNKLPGNDVKHIKTQSQLLDANNQIQLQGNFGFFKDQNLGNSIPFFENISFVVKLNKLNCIVGKVGSGKSSLISCIIGQMVPMDSEATVFKKGAISFAPQTPWLWSKTIRENILFFEPYDEERYNTAVKACCLDGDLGLFEEGDETVVGENGANLSGGQKQRVSLARCVYRKADTYIFDDPLSAIDPILRKKIFDQVFCTSSGFLKDKTQLIVSNDLSIPEKSDFITLINDSKIIFTGTFSEAEKDSEYVKYSNEVVKESTESQSIKPAEVEPIDTSGQKIDESVYDTLRSNAPTLHGSLNENQYKSLEIGYKDMDVDLSKLKSLKSWYNYFSLFPLKYLWSFVITFLLSAGITTIAYHIFYEAIVLEPDQKYWGLDVSSLIWLWAGLMTLACILGFGYTIFAARGALNSSSKLHKESINNFIHWSMSKIEATTSGNLLNIFSNDFNIADLIITTLLINILPTIETMVWSLFIFAITEPYTIAISIGLVIIFLFVEMLFATTSRRILLRKIKSNGPVLTHISETATGISTINTFDKENEMTLLFESYFSAVNKWYTMEYTLEKWLQIQLILLVLAFDFSVIVLHLLISGTPTERSASLSFMLSFSSRLALTMILIAREYGLLESNLVAIQRILNFTKYQTELNWEQPSPHAKDLVVEKGAIKFDRFSLNYKAFKALDRISLNIEPGDKVLLCGKTGSGKSTLAMALFFLRESYSLKGDIFIDGQSLHEVSLDSLRSQITVIPQSSTVIKASIRSNLDPQNIHTDSELWEVLEKSHLDEFFKSKEEKLEFICSKDELSSGQSQLISLARALLRKSKIVILDESTSSLDEITAKRINTFDFGGDTTVLMIAHRISSFLHCNKVVVLNEGKLEQAETMSEAMNNTNKPFYKMLHFDEASQ